MNDLTNDERASLVNGALQRMGDHITKTYGAETAAEVSRLFAGQVTPDQLLAATQQFGETKVADNLVNEAFRKNMHKDDTSGVSAMSDEQWYEMRGRQKENSRGRPWSPPR